MTFEELLTKVRDLASKTDASGRDFLAVQVNITGKEGGVFYVEVKDGRINVEPYEYNDRNCAITINMTNFNKLIDGKLDPILAFTTGKLKVDGDAGKALEFSKLLKK
ncbi:MAG: SCP2 sterol-binding domain-containing protein [Lachnospiraceae bacterium]|jgi:putative sterol carrier protein|nr:SCP2 sterol-binding domain-containing protein [Lachnospiraceae bacterium]MCR5635060.1 SCP2 sterol-binding domain-containing protein [Lachnospiraceae bacterium]